MKEKCHKCGTSLDIRVDKITVAHYQNHISLGDEVMINVYHQTFCENCGELIYGVKRKLLKYEDIIKLMEDNKYGKL